MLFPPPEGAIARSWVAKARRRGRRYAARGWPGRRVSSLACPPQQVVLVDVRPPRSRDGLHIELHAISVAVRSCCTLSTTWDGGEVLWSVHAWSRSPMANSNGCPAASCAGTRSDCPGTVQVSGERLEGALSAILTGARNGAPRTRSAPWPRLAFDRAALGPGQGRPPSHRSAATGRPRKGAKPSGSARDEPASTGHSSAMAERRRRRPAGARDRGGAGGLPRAVRPRWPPGTPATRAPGRRSARPARGSRAAQRRSGSSTSQRARRRSGQPYAISRIAG